MGDEIIDSVYVHQLADKIAAAKVDNAWLSEQTGIPTKLIYDWVRTDGKGIKSARVPTDNENRLAVALRGKVEWPEWRDTRSGLSPTAPDREDTARRFFERVKRETSAPPTPVAPAQIVLVPARPSAKDVKFANFFIESYGAQSVPEGGDFEMFYEVYCEPYEVCGCLVGFRQFEVFFDLPPGEGRSWRRIASPADRGAVIVEPHGPKTDAFVKFVARKPPLRLNLFVSEDTLGAFCGARAGDKLTVRMQASLESSFVQQRPSAPVEEEAKRINGKRVRELLARKKVLADLGVDEEEVVLATQILTVRESERPK